ncbi:MAG: hypothetical protein ACK5D5_01250 [Bacteroidota bacterium]|jgi:hypothetical protein
MRMLKEAKMKMRLIKQIIFILSLIFVHFLSGQTDRTAENAVMQLDFCSKIDDYFIKNQSKKFHSSFKPYLYLTLREYQDSISNIGSFPVDHHYFLQKTIFQKPNYRSSLSVQVLPVIDLQGGFDLLRNNFVSEKSGGIYLRKDINHDFSAALTVSGGINSYPVFTDTIIKNLSIIPGQGLAYGNNNEYQWANLNGYISYTPKSLFNFQLGKDKHFIGDGYRSLLLSDVANNYPYFRSSINIWNIQYSCWYSWFRDIYNSEGKKANFLNRFGTFHYLSWNINEKINLSLFETIIFQGTDSNRVRQFDVNYLNPIIFFRPVEYSLGSSDNALIGLNFSWKFQKKFKFYAQAVADEFYLKEIKNRRGWWANKQGFQLGLKAVDLFSIKNLSLQAEFNTVRPYTYSHGSPQQSYTHFNQPLAHPFGANFYEGVGIIGFKHKNWALNLKVVYANIGMDTVGSLTSMGQNLFLSYLNRPQLSNGNPSDFGHYTGQGVKTDFFQSDLKFTYYLKPEINLRIELGYIQTNLSNELGFVRQAPFVYLGLKSSMNNFYRDF